MICKMYTINGKAPTIGNTALTGSAIADPSVVLHLSSNRLSDLSTYGDYVGFSIRTPKSGVNTATYDYSNMCYCSTAYYENPNPADLTPLRFLSTSADLQSASDYLYWHSKNVCFPVDFYSTAINVPGAYYIPVSAYDGGFELYIYMWLPDLTTAPDENDQVGLDCTLLETSAHWNMDIIRAKLPAMNYASFNQACIKTITNADIAYDDQTFGYGDVIQAAGSGLGNIELISGSKLGCYNYQGIPPVKSAYNSELTGFPIDYAENCTIYGGLDTTTVKSAKNCKLSCFYQSADNCYINLVNSQGFNGSAYNSTVDWNNRSNNGNQYFYNCNILNAPQYSDTARWLAVNCNASGSASYPSTGSIPIGTYKNSYYSYVRSGEVLSSWYLEDFPTLPPVLL